jgi:hypothetical protein
VTGVTDSGNLTFTGTSNLITGDFSNATVANRVSFQSSTTNGNTVLTAIPNGTSTTGAYNAANNSDIANSSIAQIVCTSTESSFRAQRNGTGTFLPLTFHTNAGEQMRIDTSGNVGIGTSSPVGKLNVVGGVGIGFALTGDQALTPPSGSLVFSGTNVAAEQTYTSIGVSTTLGQIYNYASTANSFARYLDIVAYGSSSGAGSNIRLFTSNGFSNSERIRVTEAGSVGIGTTTPTAQLQVAGSSSVSALKIPNIEEVATISATAATGTINYDITTQSVLFYTSNATANWTVNFRGSSGTSLNTLMQTGESMSCTFLATQGATAYYNSVVQVDGTTSGVTTRWQGSAPTSGNASSLDSYTYVIIKTGAATFTVLATQTKFV